jgi:hypothetical protein
MHEKTNLDIKVHIKEAGEIWKQKESRLCGQQKAEERKKAL